MDIGISQTAFRSLLDLFMGADPSPLEPHRDQTLKSWLDRASQAFGFNDWIDAYHNFREHLGEHHYDVDDPNLPSCLWCGRDTTRYTDGDSEPYYECTNPTCVAEGTPVKRSMLERFPVPSEMEVWQVVATLNEDTPHEHVIEADWLGLFASEDAANGAILEVFAQGGDVSTSECQALTECRAFSAEACPVLLEFKGGV